MALRELRNIGISDLRLHALLTFIDFISDDNDLHISLPMLWDLGKPDFQVLEAFLLKKVKAEDDALGSLVVRVGDGAIALLTSCIPDLKLNFSLAVVDRAEAEVYADSCWIILDEVVICEAY